jgi:phage replication-related protein YjqB (UPF0714/DUF867 family)
VTDTYVDYAALAAAETLGVDYRIRAYDRDPRWAVIAIHAGGIETGMSELCRAVAGEEAGGHTWSEYRFEGLKASGNSTLHITSTNFDEPNALALTARHIGIVSLHGTTGTSPCTYLGGLDVDTRDRIGDALTAAGFTVQVATGDLVGIDPANIANAGLLEIGAQLEITTAQRSAWFATNTAAGRWTSRNATFAAYVDAIRVVLDGQVELG